VARVGKRLRGLRQAGSMYVSEDIFGKTPETPLGQVSEAGKEGAYAALGEGVGQYTVKGLGISLPRAKNEMLTLFEKYNVGPTMSDIGGSFTRIVQTLFSAMLGGAGVIAKRRGVQASEVLVAKAGLLDAIGPALGERQVGNRLANQVLNQHELLFSRPKPGFAGGLFSEAYERLYSWPTRRGATLGETVLRTEPYVKAGEAARDTISTVAGQLDAVRPGISGSAQNVINQALAFANPAHAPTGATFKDVHRIYTDLGDVFYALPDKGAGGKARTAVAELRNAVRGILDDGANGVSPQVGQYWQDLTRTYSEAAQTFGSGIVNDLLELGRAIERAGGGDAVPRGAVPLTGEDAFKKIFGPSAVTEPLQVANTLTGKIFSSTPGFASQTVSAMRTGSAMDMAVIRRRFADELLTSAARVAKEVAGKTKPPVLVSGQSLTQQWETGIPQETKNLLFTKRHQRDIAEYGGLMTRLFESISTSSVGRQLLASGEVSAVTGVAAYVVTGDPVLATYTVLGSLAAPAVGARIMASPKWTRIVAEGNRYRWGSKQFIEWLPRVANVIRSAQREIDNEPPSPEAGTVPSLAGGPPAP